MKFNRDSIEIVDLTRKKILYGVNLWQKNQQMNII